MAIYLREAAPFGLLELDEPAFTEPYLGRLEAFGLELFERHFTEISEAYDKRGLVFL